MARVRVPMNRRDVTGETEKDRGLDESGDDYGGVMIMPTYFENEHEAASKLKGTVQPAQLYMTFLKSLQS